MIKERSYKDIVIVAGFLVHALKRGDWIFSFPNLEKELELTKQQIINVFNLFKKAKVIEFTLMQWDPQDDDDYYFKPTKEVIERRTGGFSLGVLSHIFELEGNVSKGLITKAKETKELAKYTSFRPNIDILDKIINSEYETLSFLRKYGRYYDSTLSREELKNDVTDNNLVFGDLVFSNVTGDFSFYGVGGNLPKDGQEFRVLRLLLISEGYQSSYEDLTSVMNPGSVVNTSSKLLLSGVIKNIKNKMGILGVRKEDHKKDIFKAVTKFGYRLVDK